MIGEIIYIVFGTLHCDVDGTGSAARKFIIQKPESRENIVESAQEVGDK